MMISLIRFLTKLNIIPLITNLSSLIIMIFINVFNIKFVAIFENKIMEYFQLIKKKCYKTFYQANKLYPLFKKMKKELKKNHYRDLEQEGKLYPCCGVWPISGLYFLGLPIIVEGFIIQIDSFSRKIGKPRVKYVVAIILSIAHFSKNYFYFHKIKRKIQGIKGNEIGKITISFNIILYNSF